MDWLKEEVSSWFLVIFGIGMMLVSMAIIDFFSGATERIWRKKDDSD